MTDARSFLLESLRAVIAGGDITNEELAAAIPDPARLRGAERRAWHGLSYWADDGDIRAKDPDYGPMRRQSLAALLARLEAEMSEAEALAAGYLPSEIERGEHLATRVSGWGCVGSLTVLAVGAWALFG
jgi:hypothetical protein